MIVLDEVENEHSIAAEVEAEAEIATLNVMITAWEIVMIDDMTIEVLVDVVAILRVEDRDADNAEQRTVSDLQFMCIFKPERISTWFQLCLMFYQIADAFPSLIHKHRINLHTTFYFSNRRPFLAFAKIIYSHLSNCPIIPHDKIFLILRLVTIDLDIPSSSLSGIRVLTSLFRISIPVYVCALITPKSLDARSTRLEVNSLKCGWIQ